MTEIIAVFIPITAIISILVGVYFYFRFRNSERLALIESGADAGIFKRKNFSFPWLKVGILVVGIGVGILVGSFLQGAFNMFEDTGIVLSMFLFGGLGMVLAAKLDNPQKEEAN